MTTAAALLATLLVVGDGIPAPLADAPGDAARGRAIVGDRQKSLCLLCHTAPFPDATLQGTVAPSLAGAGSRWSDAQLRLRIADPRALNPQTIMPAFGRADGGERVGPAFAGRPVLDGQQIEDVVAYLRTLK